MKWNEAPLSKRSLISLISRNSLRELHSHFERFRAFFREDRFMAPLLLLRLTYYLFL